MAGIDSGRAAQQAEPLARKALLMPNWAHLQITNDCALLAAGIELHGCKHGIVLIAGTGSVASAYKLDAGKFQLLSREGGYGHLIGDEGR